MTKYLHYKAQASAPLGGASVTLNKVESILSFEEVPTYRSSAGPSHLFSDMDLVQVSPNIVRVTTPSGEREIPISYSDFARAFNQTAEGDAIDVASLPAPDGKTVPQRASDNIATAAASPAVLKPGDRMQDGTISAGFSPDTVRPMYTTSHDAPLAYTFNEAAEYAKQLNAQRHLGYDDWRAPSEAELDSLWKNRDQGALKGTFNLIGPASFYWSSTGVEATLACAQRFSNGHQYWIDKGVLSSLRCVRG